MIARPAATASGRSDAPRVPRTRRRAAPVAVPPSLRRARRQDWGRLPWFAPFLRRAFFLRRRFEDMDTSVVLMVLPGRMWLRAIKRRLPIPDPRHVVSPVTPLPAGRPGYPGAMTGFEKTTPTGLDKQPFDKVLTDELVRTIREELRAELREQTSKQRRKATLYAASGAAALYAGAAVALAAGLALALGLPGWAAALIMGVLLGLAAVLLRGAAHPRSGQRVPGAGQYADPGEPDAAAAAGTSAFPGVTPGGPGVPAPPPMPPSTPAPGGPGTPGRDGGATHGGER
ncbi:hypothetical protein SALBM135S_09888 [Streptomyces alboniger]